MTNKISDETILKAVQTHGSQRKAAQALGMNSRTVERRMKQIKARRGYDPEYGLNHPLPEGLGLKRVSTLYGKEGEITSQWVIGEPDRERMEQMIREAIAATLEDLPRLPKRKATGRYDKDVMACYPIGDAHIGMRAWAEECGDNWDLKIAERVQCGAMNALVEGAPPTESATIINLGDWFHYDSMAPVTPRSGHQVDSDGRYGKIIRIGIKIMRQCIESALSKHKYVHVKNVIGNHDETGALWLSQMLANIYENEPRVSVDVTPSLFSYIEYGSTLVGLHHGHTCKPDKLPAVMAADMAQAWGRTKYRYWWLGHVHHQSVKEYPGCIVETFNTLASKDAYATQGGWRSQENMKMILLHKDYGEIGRHTVNPQMLTKVH